MLQSELMKNRFWCFSLSALGIYSLATAIISGFLLYASKLAIETAYKLNAFINLCQIFIFFMIPFGIIIFSILILSWEERFGGWRIVLTCRIPLLQVHLIKLFLIFLLVFCMCSPLAVSGMILMDAYHSIESVFSMLASFTSAWICFLPWCVVVYFATLFTNNILSTICCGMLLIISTIFISSSAFEKFDLLCYPYFVIFNNDSVGFRVFVAVISSGILTILGSLFSSRQIANTLS